MVTLEFLLMVGTTLMEPLDIQVNLPTPQQEATQQEWHHHLQLEVMHHLHTRQLQQEDSHHLQVATQEEQQGTHHHRHSPTLGSNHILEVRSVFFFTIMTWVSLGGDWRGKDSKYFLLASYLIVCQERYMSRDT